MQVAVNFAGIGLMIATASLMPADARAANCPIGDIRQLHETARSSAASPSLNGHGFDFLNGFHATG
jgi:hypothetical protein